MPHGVHPPAGGSGGRTPPAEFEARSGFATLSPSGPNSSGHDSRRRHRHSLASRRGERSAGRVERGWRGGQGGQRSRRGRVSGPSEALASVGNRMIKGGFLRAASARIGEIPDGNQTASLGPTPCAHPSPQTVAGRSRESRGIPEVGGSKTRNPQEARRRFGPRILPRSASSLEESMRAPSGSSPLAESANRSAPIDAGSFQRRGPSVPRSRARAILETSLRSVPLEDAAVDREGIACRGSVSRVSARLSSRIERPASSRSQGARTSGGANKRREASLAAGESVVWPSSRLHRGGMSEATMAPSGSEPRGRSPSRPGAFSEGQIVRHVGRARGLPIDESLRRRVGLALRRGLDFGILAKRRDKFRYAMRERGQGDARLCSSVPQRSLAQIRSGWRGLLLQEGVRGATRAQEREESRETGLEEVGGEQEERRAELRAGPGRGQEAWRAGSTEAAEAAELVAQETQPQGGVDPEARKARKEASERWPARPRAPLGRSIAAQPRAKFFGTRLRATRGPSLPPREIRELARTSSIAKFLERAATPFEGEGASGRPAAIERAEILRDPSAPRRFAQRTLIQLYGARLQWEDFAESRGRSVGPPGRKSRAKGEPAELAVANRATVVDGRLSRIPEVGGAHPLGSSERIIEDVESTGVSTVNRPSVRSFA
ncbi:hypothetical protein KM043_000541 [Ampulex compressa]|nr:hypothetical protein KM043_000541 [Ampulex compressa]